MDSEVINMLKESYNSVVADNQKLREELKKVKEILATAIEEIENLEK